MYLPISVTKFSFLHVLCSFLVTFSNSFFFLVTFFYQNGFFDLQNSHFCFLTSHILSGLMVVPVDKQLRKDTFMNKDKNRPSKLEELLKPIAGENRFYLEKLEICGTDKFENKPLSALSEDDQMSIVSDAMLKTMLGSEKFKIYICKLLLDLLDCDIDYLMENTRVL